MDNRSAWQDAERTIEERARALVSQMTVEEKLSWFTPGVRNPRLGISASTCGGEGAPGEHRRAEFSVDSGDLEIYMESEGRKLVEPGSYRVYAGGNCLDERASVEIGL